METLPLRERVQRVLENQQGKPVPTKQRQSDPAAKLLDELYEALQGENSVQATEALYQLTTLLGFEEQVGFTVPEPEEDEPEPVLEPEPPEQEDE